MLLLHQLSIIGMKLWYDIMYSFFLLFLQDKRTTFDVNLDISTVFVLLTRSGRSEDHYVFLWKWVDIDNVFFQD
jgi:hypothetical protein